MRVDPQQLDLLACFVQAPGALITKQELLTQVWGGRAIADSAISVAVAKLRKVLRVGAGAHESIANRYGRGYRFMLPVTVLDLPRPNAPVAVSEAPSLPMVGRAESLQQLMAAVHRTLNGEGGMCALLGEPGVGKTRLAEAVERGARQRGLRTAWGRFMAEGAPPLWPLMHLLRELNVDGVADAALALLREQAVPASAPAGDTSDALAQRLWLGVGMSIHQTLDEISAALFRLSKLGPLLILLDDLQWADVASLRLLNYMLGDTSRAPLLFVVTARSTELGADTPGNRELLRLLSQHKCERVELARLTESDIAEFISASFEGDATELTRAVLARSEGNPFFMIELLRPWLGLSQPQPEQLRISGLALDVVRQRLSALPKPTREALAAASVIGHDFDLGLLCHVTGHDADALLEALDGSLANETVVASNHVPGAYAFGHELIREVLYAELAVSERCRFHLRVAHALARRRAGGVEVSDAELAQHFLSALPQGDVSVALERARAAAQTATQLGAHADARALLQRALEALKFAPEPDPQTLTALVLELAIVERFSGEPTYIEHLERGVALAREHRFGPLLLIAGQMLSPRPGLLARSDACSVLEAAVEVLPESDHARRAIALTHLAWTPPHCLSARRVAQLLGAAQELVASSNDAAALARLHEAQLFFYAGPATWPQAEAVARAVERDLMLSQGRNARSFGFVSLATFRVISALQRGDAAGTQSALEQRQEALAKCQNTEMNWHHERLLLILRINRGDFAGMDAALEQLRARAKLLRVQAWPALWMRAHAELLYWTGDVSVLAQRLRPTLAFAEAELPSTRARKLRYMLDLGFEDDARAALSRVSVEWLDDVPHDRDYLEVMCQVSTVAAALRSREHCTFLYEKLRPWPHLYAAGISFHSEGSVSHHLGLLARALGDDAAALSHFEHAVQRNAAFGLKALTVQSQLELARVLRATGAAPGGAEVTTAALVDAKQLGLRSLTRALEELHSTR